MNQANKRRWYHNIYLEFHIVLPFIEIGTRLFREAIERYAYDICRVRIAITRPNIWKMQRKTYSFEFKLYKRPLL